MSRIGKRILKVPDNVEVVLNNNTVEVSGKLGKLNKSFNDCVSISLEDNLINIERKNDDKFSKQMHGTANSLINSMMIGVSKGFKKELKIIGVGYRANLKNDDLTINVGYSHPIVLKVPEGIKLDLPKATSIIISGIDKRQVGQFAADIRKTRKPNVYSKKGIMYINEQVIWKEGKTAGK